MFTMFMILTSPRRIRKRIAWRRYCRRYFKAYDSMYVPEHWEDSRRNA